MVELYAEQGRPRGTVVEGLASSCVPRDSDVLLSCMSRSEEPPPLPHCLFQNALLRTHKRVRGPALHETGRGRH